MVDEMEQRETLRGLREHFGDSGDIQGTQGTFRGLREHSGDSGNIQGTQGAFKGLTRLNGGWGEQRKTLEQIGRARKGGALQSVLAKNLNVVNSNFFFVVQILVARRLVRR
jgi:hypothetical protein